MRYTPGSFDLSDVDETLRLRRMLFRIMRWARRFR